MNLKNLTVIAGCVSFLTASSFALSLSDPGAVGTIRSGEPSSLANEVVYVNNLLGLGANATTSIDGHNYATSSTDYNGTVTEANGVQGPSLPSNGGTIAQRTVSGWDYVLGKYDGPNGGDFVWYLGGATFTLPATSAGLWDDNNGNGYGISHIATFNQSTRVPDGGATIALLGAGILGLGALRRKLS